jgi:hypothetical protein
VFLSLISVLLALNNCGRVEVELLHWSLFSKLAFSDILLYYYYTEYLTLAACATYELSHCFQNNIISYTYICGMSENASKRLELKCLVEALSTFM